MRYKIDSVEFSFDLPAGWRRDQFIRPITFFGPNGGLGKNSEIIQLKIGGINPKYVEPAARETFLAEPSAEVFRTEAGGEKNAIVLKTPTHGEISVVRDGMHYQFSHSNDAKTMAAIDLIRSSAQFPIGNQAAAVSKEITTADTSYLGKYFENEASCAICERHMIKLQEAKGRVIITREEDHSNIGTAEECKECGRRYCDRCYPSRPKNDCLCGKGRDIVETHGGVTYRGSMRLVKVQYTNHQTQAGSSDKVVKQSTQFESPPPFDGMNETKQLLIALDSTGYKPSLKQEAAIVALGDTAIDDILESIYLINGKMNSSIRVDNLDPIAEMKALEKRIRILGTLKRPVAIKAIFDALADSAIAASEFRRKANIIPPMMSMLAHQHKMAAESLVNTAIDALASYGEAIIPPARRYLDQVSPPVQKALRKVLARVERKWWQFWK
jgi:hypothetical protein